MTLTAVRPKIPSYPKYLDHATTHADKTLIDERYLGVYEGDDQSVLFEFEGKPQKVPISDELRHRLTKYSSDSIVVQGLVKQLGFSFGKIL